MIKNKWSLEVFREAMYSL